MKLTIRRYDDPDIDLCCIERAEHDGRTWWEPGVHGRQFCKSSRLCGVGGFSADIEGCTQVMRDVAQTIRERGEVSFRHCSVDACREPVLFGSPRCDNGVRGEATYAEADDLAEQIEALLG